VPPNDSDFLRPQVGQRLCKARFVLTREILVNPESSSYWLAEDRDHQNEVVVYFLPESLRKERDWMQSFFNRVDEWTQSVDTNLHSVVHVDPENKPHPIIVLRGEVGCGLDHRLIRKGPSTVWEDVEPLIEKVVRHLIVQHAKKRLHGRLSQDHIRFLPNDEVIFLSPQLDRIAFQVIHEHTGEGIPDAWEPHGSPECVKNAQCRASDEVYSLSSILLESLRRLGIDVDLPKHVKLDGRIRFGNLLVPSKVKQVLVDVLDGVPGQRPVTASRLAALLGFQLNGAMAFNPGEFTVSGTASWVARFQLLFQALLHRNVRGLGLLLLATIFIGWFVVEYRGKAIVQKNVLRNDRQVQNLALNLREGAPRDTESVDETGSSSLRVTTIPADALVTLSGEGLSVALEDFSPVTWHHLKSGIYQLSVLAAGHTPTNLVPMLHPGKTRSVELTLSEAPNEVRITTQPPGGYFRFQDLDDSWVVGKTPHKLFLEKGDYLFHFSLNDKTSSSLLKIENYRAEGMDVIGLFDDCRLFVQTFPNAVEVWIHQAFRGYSPLVLTGLSCGDIEIELRKSGFGKVVRTIELQETEPGILRVVLEPVESGDSTNESGELQ
jgi:hypothetical protein